MAQFTKYVSTEMSDDQKLDFGFPTVLGRDLPDFPSGMKIEFDENLLEKLDLGHDCEPGDYLHIRAFAVVTAVHREQKGGKDKASVCLTLEKISVESEDEEADDADKDDAK
jgi:hypothetical protein